MNVLTMKFGEIRGDGSRVGGTEFFGKIAFDLVRGRFGFGLLFTNACFAHRRLLLVGLRTESALSGGVRAFPSALEFFRGAHFGTLPQRPFGGFDAGELEIERGSFARQLCKLLGGCFEPRFGVAGCALR